LGQTWKIAEVEFNLETDLYVAEYIPCFECASTNNSDSSSSCDYSRRDGCGRGCNNKGLLSTLFGKCVCSVYCGSHRVPSNIKKKIKEEESIYCDKSLPKWETLTPNEPLSNQRVEKYRYVYYRFHLPHPCIGFKVKVSLRSVVSVVSTDSKI